MAARRSRPPSFAISPAGAPSPGPPPPREDPASPPPPPMALVVSSAPLAALWRPDRRTSQGSSQSSSRRASDSSSFSSTPPSQPSKPKRRTRDADVVLHVDGCAFALHSRVLKRKCRVLHRFVAQLRAKNAVGLLASGDDHALPTDDHDHDHDPLDALRSGDPPFVLRQCAATIPAPRATRCPLLPRYQLLERTTQSPSPPPRSLRFSKVCCIAHKRSDDASPQSDADHDPRPAGDKHPDREEFSPGKENYGTTVRPRPVPRVALAPKMPFASVASAYVPSRRATGLASILNASPPSVGAGSSPSSSSSARDAPCVASDAFAVELVGASADAAATFIEFLYSGKTSGLHEGNASTITSLCKWFCMEDHLLYAALITRARGLQTAEQWMDILLCCKTLRCETKRKILIDYLLRRLSKLTSSQYRNVMDQMPLQRLSAIDDADLLAHVMTSMVNNLRNLDIWRKITFALELWMFWSFHRRFAAAVPLDHPHPISVRQPMSLVDFHHKFVSWDPVIRIPSFRLSGIDAYVAPTTLFSFGPFAFQVRYEANRNPLMKWRVVRAGTPSELDDDPEQCQYRPGLEPTFTMRGQLSIIYRVSETGPILQNDVALRYAHSARDYAKWLPLLTSSSPHSRPVAFGSNEPESEEKTQEPGSSQEETAPLEPDSDTELDPTSLALRAASPTSPVQPHTPPSMPAKTVQGELSGSSDNSPFEPMTSQLSGQFFAWGHRLCNLYHFLLVSTLFYQVPSDAPRELRIETTQARMRELPLETLLVVLQSDRLRVPEGETAVALAVARLCLSAFGALQFSVGQLRALFQCVRWCFVDLEQIMTLLEHGPRELRLYELVETQLREHDELATTPRRAPWSVPDGATPYHATTTLVEFQIEAGDRSLSPSKFLTSQE